MFRAVIGGLYKGRSECTICGDTVWPGDAFFTHVCDLDRPDCRHHYNLLLEECRKWREQRAAESDQAKNDDQGPGLTT